MKTFDKVSQQVKVCVQHTPLSLRLFPHATHNQLSHSSNDKLLRKFAVKRKLSCHQIKTHHILNALLCYPAKCKCQRTATTCQVDLTETW